jgi:hypothetical protein
VEYGRNSGSLVAFLEAWARDRDNPLEYNLAGIRIFHRETDSKYLEQRYGHPRRLVLRRTEGVSSRLWSFGRE